MSLEQITYISNAKASACRASSAILLRLRHKTGVTLVELLLFVAIISIAAAVGFPTVWQDTGKRADMKTVQGLASDIEHVRSMALMDLPGFANAKFAANSSKYEVAIKTKELSGNYVIESLTNPNFSFNPNGTLSTGAPISINIKRGTGGSTISHVDIASSGLITWSVP